MILSSVPSESKLSEGTVYGDYALASLGRDPRGEACKAKINPAGFLFVFPQFLQKASFLRIEGKQTIPPGGGIYFGFAERGGFEPPVPF